MSYLVDKDGVELLNELEGAELRLVAERCEGDRWELSAGCTYDLDGTPFKEGDTCTYDEAVLLRAHALKNEAKHVWPNISFEPNQYQINALSLLAYNIGGESAKNSSVVTCLNDAYKDPENVKHDKLLEAGSAFGMWTIATSSGPSEREVEKGYAPSTPITMPHDDSVFGWEMHKGRYRWYRIVNGLKTYVVYRRRMRGLLIRHYKEAVHSMGLDHVVALNDGEDSIYLKSKRRWNDKYVDPATKKKVGCWQDYVVDQTPFKEVYEVAKNYPLKAPEAPKQVEPEKRPIQIKEIEIVPTVEQSGRREIEASDLGIDGSKLNKMKDSKRYKGQRQADNFKLVAETVKTIGGTAGVFGAGSVPVLKQMSQPATMYAAAIMAGVVVCVIFYFIAKKKQDEGMRIYEEGLKEATRGLT
jgi:GH24 family phage-related lysozyme (muramidase)